MDIIRTARKNMIKSFSAGEASRTFVVFVEGWISAMEFLTSWELFREKFDSKSQYRFVCEFIF
jgi:hypothetical protein